MYYRTSYICLAFILTQLIVLKKEVVATKEAVHVTDVFVQKYEVLPPVEGEILPLAEVNDPVFSNKLIGEGFGVYPENDQIVAPITSEIVMIAPTKHAFGVRDENGFELLIHMGIETVELNGISFELEIKLGQQVTQGETLGRLDRSFIIKEQKDPTVIVVATSAQHPITTIEFSTPLLTFY